MAYNYTKYINDYNKENIVFVSLKLNKKYDKDILEAIDMSNKQGSIKKLIRNGLK